MQQIITLRDLSGGYGNGTDIISGIDLGLTRGERIAIIGPNGTGKSTLLKAMAGLLPHYKGSVLIGGKELRSMSTREVARKVAILSCQMQPSSITVIQYILLGLTPHRSLFCVKDSSSDIAEAERILKMIGIGCLSERAMNALSDGQRRMAGLARTMMQKTEIVLLDEPTANLDPANRQKMLNIIDTICAEKKRTVVAVHHDINIAIDHAEKIILMKDGHLAWQGGTHDVDTNILSEVYGIGFERATTEKSGKQIYSAV